MKKFFCFLMTLVVMFSITVSALAAPAAPENPFNVPTKHWAYDAVDKLVKAGVIDGYLDGSFHGDQTLTRYEMAQIVAKAMANESKADAETKVVIDKLAVEFQSELRTLGARVDKLETKVNKLAANSSTLKFSGDLRFRYLSADTGANNPTFYNRLRLVASGDINDDVSVYIRDVLLEYNEFGKNTTNDSQGPYTNMSRTNVIADANATYKNLLPGVSIRAGRYSPWLGQTGYLFGPQGGFDGIETVWKDGKGSLKVAYGDAAVIDACSFDYASTQFANVSNMYYGEYSYIFNPALKADVVMMKSKTRNQSASMYASNNDLLDITGAGVTWKINPDWAIMADYWQNRSPVAKAANNGNVSKAYVARLAYKENKISVPGSWGAFIEYQKFPPYTWDQNWTGSLLGGLAGFKDSQRVKCWDFQYSVTLLKNFTFDAIYAFNIKNSATGADNVGVNGNNWTRLQLTFFF
jgi:polyhydroxyalkanoate synthesis regulator phasin